MTSRFVVMIAPKKIVIISYNDSKSKFVDNYVIGKKKGQLELDWLLMLSSLMNLEFGCEVLKLRV